MFIFEVIGTIAFAMVGSLIGVQKRLDMLGVIMTAITTAVGGGIFRDILLGNTPPMIFRNSDFLFLSIFSAIPVFIFGYRYMAQYQMTINVLDAIGLGAFAAAGANMALQYNDTLLLVLTIAVITAVGGGAIRDVMIREIPFVLCREVYALAVILGAASFYVVYPYFPQPAPMYVCFIVTTAVRLVSLKYSLNLPTFSESSNGVNICVQKVKNQFFQ